MSRSDIPEEDRKDFALYVDEFQNFSTDSFATIMSEARKYHLNLIVANQFTTQLTEEIRDAVFGNIGTIVSFRIGQNDVESLGRYFQPHFDGDDLLRVPNANTIVRTLISGVPTQPFSMATLPPLGNPNPHLADALKQLSAVKYGHPRATVEKAIFERLATKAPEPKPFANPFGASPAGAPGAATPPPLPAAPVAAPGSGSFLDEWLAKQKAAPPQPQRLAAPQPAPAPAPASAPEPMQAPVPDVPQFQPASPQAAIAEGTDVQPPLPQATPVTPTEPAPVEDTEQSSPQPSSGTIYEGGNISSAQLDQQEVKDIAMELKKGLKPQETPTPAAIPSTAAPGPLVADAEEDTIYIDADGVMHQKNPVDSDD